MFIIFPDYLYKEHNDGKMNFNDLNVEAYDFIFSSFK
ncbi:hypothetical protein J2T04_000194 [Chryseobacterium lathyri]|uniref:Uncharacterized protein n=1 Tax=Chryseobacterium lathyri TaxID=395933 RepID=A0ABT9SFX2_9FLAO|nr:hypothetical protein [Chryseobacterium lathyri]MDQ0066358.1 hypothetical protein [Chryseobacterium lathyri]